MEEQCAEKIQHPKQNMKDHGLTKGCPGCEAGLRGKARQGHTEKCRKRFEEAMKDDERVKASKAKVDEFISKAIEKAHAEERKRKEEEAEGRPGSEGKKRKEDEAEQRQGGEEKRRKEGEVEE